MKKFLSLVFLLGMTLFCSCLQTTTPVYNTPPPQQGSGYTCFDEYPYNASVFVDGVFVGTVSQFEPDCLYLPYGDHHIAVLLNNEYFFDNDVYVFEGRHHPREEFEEHGRREGGGGNFDRGGQPGGNHHEMNPPHPQGGASHEYQGGNGHIEEGGKGGHQGGAQGGNGSGGESIHGGGGGGGSHGGDGHKDPPESNKSTGSEKSDKDHNDKKGD
jgi:hypothetical protein